MSQSNSSRNLVDTQAIMSTTTIQSLYLAMRSEAMKDPVMKALFHGEVSWADVYSAEDELNWK